MHHKSNLRGIALMIAATAVFVVNDTFLKLATNGLPPFQTLFLRGVAATLWAVPLVILTGNARAIAQVADKWVVARNSMELAAVLCFIVALKSMPIADITALGQIAPMLLLLGVGLIYHERLGALRMGLIGLGFLGAVLVAQPSGAGVSPYAILGFVMAAGTALRDIIGRKVPGHIPGPVVALSAILVVMVGALACHLVFEQWAMPPVQNLLYLRFANSVFEPLWNRDHIESIEIEALETVGIGTRGGYYDRAGAARDMLQNHLLQLLCLTAMEPPASLDPEAIRDEKVKVLRSVPRYAAAEWKDRSLRARYAAGNSATEGPIPHYLGEAKVAPESTTETFVALRLEVDNWRFAGVPFVLRTGKALDRRSSEIRVRFRAPPRALFSDYGGELGQNLLTIKIQPDEGVWFSFNMKVPGRPRVEQRDLRFSWREGDGLPEAYERLLDDAIRGDSTLFIRADESEAAWELVDELRRSWNSAEASPLLEYPAGAAPLALGGRRP